MNKKTTVITSSSEHHVSLSTDKRVAARSHLGKRASSAPVDRISTSDHREGPGDNYASLQTSAELEARIKLLAQVTENLQQELRAVQENKTQALQKADANKEVAELDKQVHALSQENLDLQAELEALKAKVAAVPSEVQTPVAAHASKPGLKKKHVVTIQSLSDAGNVEVDLEKRMKHIRAATHNLRIELETLVKSSQSKG